jgi:50S ribosomal protein L16 3-hydroxylase
MHNRTAIPPGLSALLGPQTSAAFMASYAANKPFVVHGLALSVEQLTALPFLASLDQLLNSWPHQVSAALPDVADESSAIDASTIDARKLFDNGMSLLFNEAHSISPPLQHWLAAIRRDIGLSELTQSRCLIYATPKGKGTSPHFDQNINFVLQVHGQKQWTLATNNHVHNPLTRHTIGALVDPELQTYSTLPMPDQMPTPCETILLSPGSMLFVPRGTWHSTHGVSDALALNFTYSAPTWIDVFTAALRGRLAMSPEWRETAMPATPEQFQRLLSDLSLDARHWLAEDILEATEATCATIV